MSLDKWKKKDRFQEAIEKVQDLKKDGLTALEEQLFSKKSEIAEDELSTQSGQVYRYLVNARWIFILVSFTFALVNTFMLVVYKQGTETGLLAWYLVISLWAYSNIKYAKRDDFREGGNRLAVILGDIAATLLIIHYSGGIYSFGAFLLPLLVFEPVLTGQLQIERWLIAAGLIILYAAIVLLEHFGILSPVIPSFLNLSHQHYFSFEIMFIIGMGILIFGTTFIGNYFAEDLKRTKETIQELVDMDSLTGTYNREVFFNELEYEITKCSLATRVVSVLLLSVDNLQEINHNQGYRSGDELLSLLGTTINNNIRKKEREDAKSKDIACRIKTNTFGLILPELNPAYIQSAMRSLKAHEHSKGVHIVANRLVSRIEEAVGNKYKIVMSIGIANWPAHGSRASTLIRQAELALEKAQQRDRDKIVNAEKPSSE